ncbi:hypothetical protein [Williamsia sp.]|nr:hypothetical protein [Williamsia sp.]
MSLRTHAGRPHSTASIRFWRVVAMVAPLVALVIGMLLVVGSMG